MIRQTVLTVALLVSTLTTSGCALFLVGAGVAVGAGAVAYAHGELRATEEVSLDRAWDATLRAMEELQFPIVKKQKDALAGSMEARRADNTRVLVTIKKQSNTLTEIRIRVGTFGDESLSRLILEKIKNRM